MSHRKIEDYQQLDTRTTHLTIPQMVTTFISTATSLKSHSFFGIEGNWPGWLQGAPQYLSYADNLRVLDDAYRAGNKTKKAELDLVRRRAAYNYQLGGHYVTMRAYEMGNPDLLLDTFPLKPLATKFSSAADIYTMQIVFTAKNGSRGEAVLRGHHVVKGGPYQVQYCKGSPSSEDSWVTLPEHYLTCGKIIVNNLDPVSLYYFRIRHNGPKGPGQWSQPVSLVIH